MIRRVYQRTVSAAARERLARLRRYLGAVEFARARRVGGMAFAVRHWLAALLRRPATVRVNVASLRLCVRPGTSDVRTLEQVAVDEQYGLPLPSAPATIIDAGANIGASALYFTRRWPDAKIVALEPEASNFAVLCRNVRRFPQITPLPAALWHEVAPLALANPTADKWSFRMGPSSQPDESAVAGWTVSALLDHLGWARVDLLKIDIEGAERELFTGGAPWLERVGTWVLEVHEQIAPGAAAVVAHAARAHGFTATPLGESTWFTRSFR